MAGYVSALRLLPLLLALILQLSTAVPRSVAHKSAEHTFGLRPSRYADADDDGGQEHSSPSEVLSRNEDELYSAFGEEAGEPSLPKGNQRSNGDRQVPDRQDPDRQDPDRQVPDRQVPDRQDPHSEDIRSGGQASSASFEAVNATTESAQDVVEQNGFPHTYAYDRDQANEVSSSTLHPEVTSEDVMPKRTNMTSDSTGTGFEDTKAQWSGSRSSGQDSSSSGVERQPPTGGDALPEHPTSHRRRHVRHHHHRELPRHRGSARGQRQPSIQHSPRSPLGDDPETRSTGVREDSRGRAASLDRPSDFPDAETSSSSEADQWSDQRTRNRNRPVIKPPDPGAGSAFFGEGHTKEEMARMEGLREQLLKQLRLGAVPEQVPPLPPLPANLDVFDDHLNDMGNEDEEDFMAPTTTQVIIFADDVTSLCQYKRSTGCYYFDQHGRLEGAVTGAELWLFKQQDPNDVYQQKLVVSELESAGGRYGVGKLRSRNIVNSLITDVTAGWVKFDVTRSVQRWADKPHKNEGLAVRCKSCRRRNHRVLWGQKEGYRPLLVVHLRPHPSRRHRRSLDCGPGITSCCRHQFYVTFRELNMPTILRPEGFYANFCTGSCEALTSHYNHTLLMQGVRMRSPNIDEATRRALTPCCSPTKLRTVSILHSEDGALKTTHVPNLSVVACGCM